MPTPFITLIVIVLLFVAAIALVRAMRGLAHRMLESLEGLSAARRAETQGRTRRLVNALSLLLYVLAAAASVSLGLSEFGAGPAGWNVQTLGRWFLTYGINVIILEDQVRVGDIARINGVSGTVEQIELRTIVLRDDQGAVQVFANGAVASLANLSKEFSFATVDVRVAYTENMDRAIGALVQVGAGMQRDPHWAPFTLAPLEVLAVESISDGAATLRAKFKTPPLTQGKVANEPRKRVLAAFVALGIRPYAG